MPTTTKTRPPNAKRIMRHIVTPDGFTRTETTSDQIEAIRIQTSPQFPSWPVLVLESSDTRIEVWFDNNATAASWSLGSGHVSFDTSAGRRSFDRYGVEDSFYVDNPLRDSGRPYLPWSGDLVEVDGGLGTIVEINGRDRWPIKVETDSGVEEFTARRFKAHGGCKANPAAQVNAAIRRFIEVRIPEARERIDKSESIPGIPFMVTAEARDSIAAKLRKGESHSFMPSGFGTGYVLSGSRGRGARAATKATCKFFGVEAAWVSTFDAD